MIDPRELRIGNQIQTDKGWRVEIRAICPEDVIVMDGDVPDIIPFCRLSGILIDEDWLLRMGFEKSDEHSDDGDIEFAYVKRYTPPGATKEDDYEIDLIVGRNFNAPMRIGMMTTEDGAVPLRDVEYVHTLQNVWQSLTNTELQLTPLPADKTTEI